MAVRRTYCPSARGVEEALQVRGEEVHGDDCPWVADYYPRVVSLDRKDVDHSVNILARIGRPGRSRTDCSHHLIGICPRDICTVPLPSSIGFLTNNGLLRGGNRRPIDADQKTVDARHPYFGRGGQSSC